MHGHLETMKWLFEHGCSIHDRNNDGDSCLSLASMNGELETLKWLLEHGSSIHEKNNDGYSCLLLVSMNGQLENNEMVVKTWMFN